jgi:tryptophan synthase alpha chain
MNRINNYINDLNEQNKKALSIFLTAGFPHPPNFVDMSLKILDAGADLLEIGIPFSDPIADGPVIQKSSMAAIENGVTLPMIFEFTEKIKIKTNKPLILMGYANPIQHYGLDRFLADAADSGADGIIVPDIPLEEYADFWGNRRSALARILLTTPTSSVSRIEQIDKNSEGFVYCVSISGTTGMQRGFGAAVLKNLERTYQVIKKNKMLIGFGISGPEDITQFSPYCDGVIVGSAVINCLLSAKYPNFQETYNFVSSLGNACRF